MYDWSDKIQKLLRKAESTNSEQEAEFLIQKAQELMVKYSIDEAVLRSRRAAEGKADRIVTSEIHYRSSYSRAQFYIGAAIAKHNDCRVLIRKGKDLMSTWLIIVGYESDVERVKQMNASLLIQSAGRLNSWWKASPLKDGGLTPREQFKERRQFLFSFASGLEEQLAAARARAEKDYQQEHSDTSVALVLADKSTQVERYLSDEYGGRLRASRGSLRGGSRDAAEAGQRAGREADAGLNPKLAGRKELAR